MKATLEFNLPDDQEDFQLVTKAQDLYFVILEMHQYLRAKIKYAPDSMSEETYKEYEDTMEHLVTLVHEHGLNFDMIS